MCYRNRKMPLQTTVIGSYPKPDYLQVPDWFVDHHVPSPRHYNDFIRTQDTTELHAAILQAKSDVIQDQIGMGLDVITDGEVSRENYIHDFCRHLNGFDFERPEMMTHNGLCRFEVPVINQKVGIGDDEDFCAEEWKEAQSMSHKAVKMTLPGPLTIIHMTHTPVGGIYKDRKQLSLDLTTVINHQVLNLVEAGCTHIQIDEPVLVSHPDIALEYGIDHLEKCFEGVNDSAQKIVHLCCGYPRALDDDDYPRADRNVYKLLADRVDQSCFDAVSLEDAHQHNDLDLFDHFKNVKVILGVVKIACSKVESVQEIKERVREVLKHIPAKNLILAPDCGLGFLPRDILQQKVTNMVLAAKSLP
ncbi:5-methyltetrahydropteroyltriglutamate--homocysteine methyltransferase-like [Tubulanus polymorphus]|uniref:5-methyltetrahydropteroyltriglutamate-- homocysteine methyltransferase-like n=1 Tax=Tubulanus polymorphus TaxID=672921 RepID=UPI003DA556CA